MKKKDLEKYINRAAKKVKEVTNKTNNSNIELPKELDFLEFPIDYIPTPFEVADAHEIKYEFIELNEDKPSYYKNDTIYISNRYPENSYIAKFLCAHELGHYFMQDKDEMAAMNNDDINKYSEAELLKEYEANVFAILLMPQFMAGLPWESYLPLRLNGKVYNKIYNNG